MDIATRSVSPTSFEPALYPRRYVPSRGWQACLGALGAIALVPPLCGLWVLGAASESPLVMTGPLLFVGCVAWGLAGACLVARASVCYQIRLTPHAIEYRGLFRARSLRRDQIARCRIGSDQVVRVIELTPVRADAPPLKVGVLFQPDRAFRAWFTGLSGMEEAPGFGPSEAGRRSPLPGLTPAERLRLAIQAKRTARLAFIPFVLANVCLVQGTGSDALRDVTILVLPWLILALAWIGRRAVTFAGHRRSVAQADLTLYFLVPIGALLVFVLKTYCVPDWPTIVAPGMGLGLALTLLVALRSPSVVDSSRNAGLILVASSIYAAGALILLNGLLAQQPVAGRLGVVISASQDQDEVTGRRFLMRSEEGPLEVLRLPPAYELFDAARPGDVVCVEEGRGALGLRFWAVERCARPRR